MFINLASVFFCFQLPAFAASVRVCVCVRACTRTLAHCWTDLPAVGLPTEVRAVSRPRTDPRIPARSTPPPVPAPWKLTQSHVCAGDGRLGRQHRVLCTIPRAPGTAQLGRLPGSNATLQASVLLCSKPPRGCPGCPWVPVVHAATGGPLRPPRRLAHSECHPPAPTKSLLGELQEAGSVRDLALPLGVWHEGQGRPSSSGPGMRRGPSAHSLSGPGGCPGRPVRPDVSPQCQGWDNRGNTGTDRGNGPGAPGAAEGQRSRRPAQRRRRPARLLLRPVGPADRDGASQEPAQRRGRTWPQTGICAYRG